MDVHPLVCHPLQKNNCGMSCSFHLAITGELTAVQQGWCTRIAASIRTVSATCSLYHRKQATNIFEFMGSHLVGAFVSIPQNKHDQSGSSFRIEQKLHHHQFLGFKHIQTIKPSDADQNLQPQNFQKMLKPPASP